MKIIPFAALAVVSSLTLGGCAQSAPPAATATTSTAAATGPDLMADLVKDVDGVEKKMIDLARAMPEGSMSWRPGAGVRSVREVFLHIAGENYVIPSLMGTTIPAATGIVGSDFKTVEAYEKQNIKHDQVVMDLEESFAHLKTAMKADSASRLGTEVDFFGSKLSRQQGWVGTVTHLHEHLGQAIAYARANKVVPPWSK